MKKFILDFLRNEDGLMKVKCAALCALFSPVVMGGFTLYWHFSRSFY